MLALAACALLGVAAGSAGGLEWGLGTFGFLTAMLVLYHLRKAHNLSRWLEHGEAPEPPRSRGAWDHLHAASFASGANPRGARPSWPTCCSAGARRRARCPTAS